MRELIYTGKRVMEYFQSPYVCVEVLTCCNHILLTFLHPRGFLLDASPQGLQCFSGIFWQHSIFVTKHFGHIK